MASADSPPSFLNGGAPNTLPLSTWSSACTPRSRPADSRAMPPSLAIATSSESTSGFRPRPEGCGEASGASPIRSSSVILPVRKRQAR